GVLNRLDVSVDDCNTTHVFVLIGVNDLGDGRKPPQLMPGYRQIVTRIQGKVPGVTIHLQSALPTRGRFAFHNPDILELNRGIKKIAEEMRCDYINLHPLFADDKGELREELTNDGLHIVQQAYDIWEREVDRVMGW
ncbi:MAG: GDSL-type esterase/lipase family protein, partial [bacterium]